MGMAKTRTEPDQRSILRERYLAQETSIIDSSPCSNSTNEGFHCEWWAFHEWTLNNLLLNKLTIG